MLHKLLHLTDTDNSHKDTAESCSHFLNSRCFLISGGGTGHDNVAASLIHHFDGVSPGWSDLLILRGATVPTLSGPPRPTTRVVTSLLTLGHCCTGLSLLNDCDLLPSYLDWTLEQAGGGGPALTVVTAPLLTAGSAPDITLCSLLASTTHHTATFLPRYLH